MNFSADQLRALALDHHVAVVANAGSGKTRVLTERFARIVRQEHARLDEVVAITFTNKAAAEMRHRVQTELAASQSEAAARNAYRAMMQARISTFHSFCGSLLRQYAGDVGIHPESRELSPRQAAAMRSSAIRAGITACLTAQHPLRESLLHAFDELGIYTVESEIRAMVASQERLLQRTEWIHSGSHEELFDRRMAQAQQYQRQQLIDVANQIASDVAIIDGAPETLKTAVASIAITLANNQVDTDVATQLQHYHEKLYTATGSARKRGLLDPSLTELSDLGVPFQQLSTLCTPPSVEAEALGLRLSATLIRVAGECAALYSQERNRRDALDFDDLLVRTRNALRDRPDVAEDVRSSIRYLMVDEFQDTNPLQYEIVQLLAPQLANVPYSGQHPNVFVVGDPKQSIYAFRDADVRLFRRAQADVAAANHRNGCTESGVVTLRASYRMHATLASGIDYICSRAFAEETEFDVSYEPLVAGRQPVDGAEGSLCLLYTNTTESDTDIDDLSALDVEARHVADHIGKRISANNGLLIATNVGARPATPGDVAILVRTSTGIDAISRALQVCGIPYHVHGGRQFFSRTEVDDIRNLLLFCTDTSDDIAFAATLRSSYIRLSESSLLDVGARRAFGTSLWQSAVDSLADEHVASDIRTAVELLREAIADCATMPLTTAVRRMMERTIWFDEVGRTERSKQILANVEKVLAILRDEQLRGRTVRDAVEAIAIPEDGDQESDNALELDPNAVQVMTTHAAKGLQFPIVVVMETNSAGGRPASVLWSDAYGLSINVPETIQLRGAPVREYYRGRSVIHEMNGKVLSGASKAENKRLLYVALTRAMDHLVISLPYAKKKDGDRASSKGIQALLEGIVPVVGDVAESYVRWESVHRRFADNELLETPASIQVAVDDAARPDVGKVRFAPTDRAGAPSVDLTNSLMHMAAPEMISVTELLSATALADEPSAATVADVVAETAGATYGTLLHFLLQHALTSTISVFDQSIDPFLRNLVASRNMSNAILDVAIAEVLATLRCKDVQGMLQSWNHASYETARTAHCGVSTLYGVMDCVGVSGSTELDVVDWKTNHISDNEQALRLADLYRPQLDAYAWLCFATSPNVTTVRTSLVFTSTSQREEGALIIKRQHVRKNFESLQANIEAAITTLVARRVGRLLV